MLEVEEVYKLSIYVNLIFVVVGVDIGGFFSVSEVVGVVFMYVEKENFVKSINKVVIILDVILCDVLFKGVIKKGVVYFIEIYKKDLGIIFLNRM